MVLTPLADHATDRQWIERAYDPELARAAAQLVVDQLFDHLQQVHRGETKVHDWRPPEENIAAAAERLRQADAAARDELPSSDEVLRRLQELAEQTLARGQNLQHPCYIGHQVPAPVPLAAVFEIAMAVTNQIQGVYEMGPWAVAVERAVIEALGQELGFRLGQFSGLVTSGGSLANLTALLTARNRSLEQSWERGLRGRRPALVIHQEAHYCVERAAGVLGIGTDQLARVALDSQRRMDPADLERTLTRLEQAGDEVVAVVAVAGATPTGAFDPLHAVADVCERHQVWLHVDAAHGGAAGLSERHRGLVDGIARADSVVIDAHKMLFVPALCALVMYRDGQHRFATFQQSAPYLFDPSAPGMAEYDNAMVTIECSKRAAAMGVWAVWSLFGKRLFRALVDQAFATAQQFHQLLEQDEAFEVYCRPVANILLFRCQPASWEGRDQAALDQLQLRIRRTLLEEGALYITQTRLDGRVFLRATVMNPRTELDHLRDAIAAMKRAADAVEPPE